MVEWPPDHARVAGDVPVSCLTCHLQRCVELFSVVGSRNVVDRGSASGAACPFGGEPELGDRSASTYARYSSFQK